MPDAKETRESDSTILVRALETVLRKLVRFLIGRVSLVVLNDMIRTIYVEECEILLRAESRGRKASLTNLAELSGLDTRTVTKIRHSKAYLESQERDRLSFRELTAGATVLDVWGSAPSFFDQSRGVPKRLKVTGSPESFEALFSEAVRSRGISPASLLKRLISSGAVVLDEQDGTVRLVRQSYVPGDAPDLAGSIELGFAAIGNLVDTVARNIGSQDTDGGRFFQRGVWIYRLSPANQRMARTDLAELLAQTDRSARDILRRYEEPYLGIDFITAGISSFYFEEGQQ